MTEGDAREYCVHSGMEDDCLSCHKGYINRQIAHIERLRQLLVDAGAQRALTLHDVHWFGGNAQPLPDPTATETPLASGDYIIVYWTDDGEQSAAGYFDHVDPDGYWVLDWGFGVHPSLLGFRWERAEPSEGDPHVLVSGTA